MTQPPRGDGPDRPNQRNNEPGRATEGRNYPASDGNEEYGRQPGFSAAGDQGPSAAHGEGGHGGLSGTSGDPSRNGDSPRQASRPENEANGGYALNQDSGPSSPKGHGAVNPKLVAIVGGAAAVVVVVVLVSVFAFGDNGDRNSEGVVGAAGDAEAAGEAENVAGSSGDPEGGVGDSRGPEGVVVAANEALDVLQNADTFSPVNELVCEPHRANDEMREKVDALMVEQGVTVAEGFGNKDYWDAPEVTEEDVVFAPDDRSEATVSIHNERESTMIFRLTDGRWELCDDRFDYSPAAKADIEL